MTTTTEKVTTQVYRVYIKATPQAVWDAITKPEWTDRYGYGGTADYPLENGGPFAVAPGAAMVKGGEEMGFPVPDVVVDGEVIEADPPRRLVLTWRMLMDPDAAAEGFTRLTYELDEMRGGVTRLTLLHDLENAPKLAALVSGAFDDDPAGGGGGWSWVLSDLKSLLETGERLNPD